MVSGALGGFGLLGVAAGGVPAAAAVFINPLAGAAPTEASTLAPLEDQLPSGTDLVRDA
ncbi:hypothetical protein OIU91_23060 [Streptomyces sp. NBC_01456]|uniref:hypothetical protein n=1 Tax=unclassified Streptomyces TaxID=2593676 RepID=UPI002E35B0A4|nr:MULTISPECIES: hypothetical protein [unclassified Streptomyces]